jgi:hypothetical protein
MNERIVVISAEQRNALYQLALTELLLFEDLRNAYEGELDLEACYRLGRPVMDTLRLIVDGGLGWGDMTSQDSVPLNLPPEELRRIMTRLRAGAVFLGESQQEEQEEKRDEWNQATLARDACNAALEQLRPGAEH